MADAFCGMTKSALHVNQFVRKEISVIVISLQGAHGVGACIRSKKLLFL